MGYTNKLPIHRRLHTNPKRDDSGNLSGEDERVRVSSEILDDLSNEVGFVGESFPYDLVSAGGPGERDAAERRGERRRKGGRKSGSPSARGDENSEKRKKISKLTDLKRTPSAMSSAARSNAFLREPKRNREGGSVQRWRR